MSNQNHAAPNPGGLRIARDSQAAAARSSEPVRLGDLIEQALAPVQGAPWFRPWDNVLPVEERRPAYFAMAKRLGRAYARCTFENYSIYAKGDPGQTSQAAARERMIAFAAELPERIRRGAAGLCLFGNVGTGKDHLVTALAYHAILRLGWRVEWANASDLYMHNRDRIDSEAISEEKFLWRLTSPLVLYLSDPVPARGPASAAQADLLLRILDRRTRDALPTWITLNATGGDDAEKRLASPIVDRMRQAAVCLDCFWESHRPRTSEA